VLTFVAHEVQDLFAHEDNPVRRVMVAGETIRRRVDVAGDALDFSILHDLKAEGATWSSDLRGFTERSDRLAGIQVIAMLNALFDAQGKAIVGHGGEILKFIGDGLLAIFPIKSADMAAAAASNP
jgi:class 3 adenylate cyclase